ncbi:hypothetical protein AB0399_10915 [Streptomyces sp. NPDC088194]|uniref:hypothetical protein n=1 Tax=Streptomyces sp. NPDC088194 TaxID=3154931 RepID=UPI00344C3C83
MASTFDTFKDLIGDVTDDYKKAVDEFLDRDDDDDDDDRGNRKSRNKRKSGGADLSALAKLPGLAGLPLGTVQALVDAGPAAPALAGLISGAANPLAALAGGAGAANPLAALAGGAGAANPLAALAGGAGAANPLAALAGGGLPGLDALGSIAGAAGSTANLAETLLSLPGQIAKLTEAVTKLLDVLPGAATVTGARKG